MNSRKHVPSMSLISMLLLGALLTGCTSETEYGKCIGMFDTKKPGLEYKLSGWNAFMGVIGTSLLFIPTIFWIKDSTFCPSGVVTPAVDVPRPYAAPIQ